MKKMLYNRVKYYREQSKLSQTDLANRLGIGRTYLSIVENNKSHPSPELMIKLCLFFECDLGDMFKISKIY